MIRKILKRSFEDYTNFGQKTMLRAFSLFGIAILALSTLSGCMWAPPNQHTSTPYLHDKTKTMTFAGALLTPNTEVTIQAYDLQAKTWEDIAKTTSYDFIWPTGSGRYNWVEHKVIPSKYWARDQQCASTGESALVRSKWAGGNLFSLAVPDMWQCRGENPNDADFIINCKAPESPNVLIPSLNYRDFGMECAETINRIRSKEGKPPLQIYEAGECDADDNSKCNYETSPHTCHPSGAYAQNECWTAGSIDEILGECISDFMYEKEKKCYEDCIDCKNCPEHPECAQSGCGHYKNMVLGNYTKVSCGVYEFQDGSGNWKFHSVQNYLP